MVKYIAEMLIAIIYLQYKRPQIDASLKRQISNHHRFYGESQHLLQSLKCAHIAAAKLNLSESKRLLSTIKKLPQETILLNYEVHIMQLQHLQSIACSNKLLFHPSPRIESNSKLPIHWPNWIPSLSPL